jgi:alkanesulfonate monooxygenase SsuD/methylene tetrahydromethanopterin reductase-like flavin-dependent oxidoreductase (luciferase family)
VGAGWNREEMRNHGTDPRTRMRLMQERIEAMKAIWAQDEASYEGEFVRFGPIWSWPKPLQRPHPPVIVGGDGPTVLDRVLAYGDGWMPNYVRDPTGSGETILRRAKELRARAERPIDLVIVRAPANAADLERLRLSGCTRAVHWLPTGGRSVVERSLERWESAVAELTGEP